MIHYIHHNQLSALSLPTGRQGSQHLAFCSKLLAKGYWLKANTAERSV